MRRSVFAARAGDEWRMARSAEQVLNTKCSLALLVLVTHTDLRKK